METKIIDEKKLTAIKMITSYTGNPFKGKTEQDAIQYIKEYLKKEKH